MIPEYNVLVDADADHGGRRPLRRCLQRMPPFLILLFHSGVALLHGRHDLSYIMFLYVLWTST